MPMLPVVRRAGEPGPRRVLPSALACAALALVVRLGLLASPFGAYDGDAAVNALLAQDLLHGRHVWLVWPLQNYAGTIDVALQAASVRLLGVGQVAVGLPLALLGAATVGLLAWTAGRCLRAPGAAVAVGLAASVYPLWLLLWGTTVGGAGYAVSGLLGVGALSLALLRRPYGPGTALLTGLLTGLALWSQPLAVSQLAVAWGVALLATGSVRRAAAALTALLLGTLPGLALWWVGLQDGTVRGGGPLQASLTPANVLDPSLVAARARALRGVIGDKALGLVAGTGPDLLPTAVAGVLVDLVGLGVLVAVVACLVRRPGPLVPALLGALVLSCVVFVLFPPSLDTASVAINAGVPRPLGVPRYVFHGMYALAALVGLLAWALLRRRGPARVGGALLALAVVLSSGLSARLLLEPGAYARTRPSSGQLEAYARALEGQGVRCVVAGYWDVYPLVLASDDRLRGESTFVNRLGVQCGAGPGVARVFARPGGQPTPEELAYARPGARTLPGPGLVAYLS